MELIQYWYFQKDDSTKKPRIFAPAIFKIISLSETRIQSESIYTIGNGDRRDYLGKRR